MGRWSVEVLILLFVFVVGGIGLVCDVPRGTTTIRNPTNPKAPESCCTFQTVDGGYVKGSESTSRNCQHMVREMPETSRSDRPHRKRLSRHTYETHYCTTDRCNSIEAQSMECRQQQGTDSDSHSILRYNSIPIKTFRDVYQPCTACVYGINRGGIIVPKTRFCWTRNTTIADLPNKDGSVTTWVFCASQGYHQDACNHCDQKLHVCGFGTGGYFTLPKIECYNGTWDDVGFLLKRAYCYSYVDINGILNFGSSEAGDCSDEELMDFRKSPFLALRCCNDGDLCNKRGVMCYHYDRQEETYSLRGGCDYCNIWSRDPVDDFGCHHGGSCHEKEEYKEDRTCCTQDWCNGEGELECWWGRDQDAIVVKGCKSCHTSTDHLTGVSHYYCNLRVDCQGQHYGISGKEGTSHWICCQQDQCNWEPVADGSPNIDATPPPNQPLPHQPNQPLPHQPNQPLPHQPNQPLPQRPNQPLPHQPNQPLPQRPNPQQLPPRPAIPGEQYQGRVGDQDYPPDYRYNGMREQDYPLPNSGNHQEEYEQGISGPSGGGAWNNGPRPDGGAHDGRGGGGRGGHGAPSARKEEPNKAFYVDSAKAPVIYTPTSAGHSTRISVLAISVLATLPITILFSFIPLSINTIPLFIW